MKKINSKILFFGLMLFSSCLTNSFAMNWEEMTRTKPGSNAIYVPESRITSTITIGKKLADRVSNNQNTINNVRNIVNRNSTYINQNTNYINKNTTDIAIINNRPAVTRPSGGGTNGSSGTNGFDGTDGTTAPPKDDVIDTRKYPDRVNAVCGNKNFDDIAKATYGEISMSRQYTDSSDELCPLGGKRKFCTENITLYAEYSASSDSWESDYFSCSTSRYYDISKSSLSEWVISGNTATASATLSSGNLGANTKTYLNVTCSGSVVSSCGASGSDVWYKRN